MQHSGTQTTSRTRGNELLLNDIAWQSSWYLYFGHTYVEAGKVSGVEVLKTQGGDNLHCDVCGYIVSTVCVLLPSPSAMLRVCEDLQYYTNSLTSHESYEACLDTHS